MATVVYAGSFDPPTKGHLDLVKRALPCFESVYVVVANNTSKKYLFSAKERVSLIKSSLKEIGIDSSKVKVDISEGLVVDYCESVGAKVLLRGIRAVSDFEAEFQIASMNRSLNSAIETLHMMPDQKYSFVSSSMIKEVSRFGGDLSEYLAPSVENALKEKWGK